MTYGVRASLMAFVSWACLAAAMPARAADMLFFAEVEARVAEGRLAEAEAYVTSELLVARLRTVDERLALFDLLAELQAQRGARVDQGDTLSDKAAVIVREFGATSPELPPVYSAAGDAYMAGGALARARDSYRAALMLDEIYLACDSPALDASFARLARALRAGGETEAADDAETQAEDRAARCGIEPVPVVETPAAPEVVAPAGPENSEAVIAALTTSRHAAPTAVASMSFTAPATPEPAPSPARKTAPAPVSMPATPPPRWPAPPTGRSIVRPATASAGDFAEIELFYGTDRAPSGDLRPGMFYGGARGEVDLGRVTVAVPRAEKPANAEMPELFTFLWPQNPAQHVVITDLDRLDPARFFAGLQARVAATGDDEVLLYIHGYDTTFAEAARRTAWMAYDLNFEGVPMFYSWPSAGRPNGYLADAAAAQVSARRLVGFLEDLVAEGDGARIHLVAQAMGGRALAQALELYAAAHPQAEAVFGQVILAAPDIDADLFALQARAIRRLATRVTLYTNSAEAGLAAAEAFQGGVPRAGQGGATALASEDFDTIDMSALGEDLLAHRASSAEPTALTDMLWLMWRDADPSARCGMTELAQGNAVSWSYGAFDCDAGLARPALTLLRRYGPNAPAHLEALRAAAAGAEGDEDADDRMAELDGLAVTIEDVLRR